MTETVSGDLLVYNNLHIGGEAVVDESMTVKKNIKVAGKIIGETESPFKGLFPSLADLKIAYPVANSREGWYALVGTAFPASVYVFTGTSWADTGTTSEGGDISMADYYNKQAVDAIVDSLNTADETLDGKVSALESGLEKLSDDIDELSSGSFFSEERYGYFLASGVFVDRSSAKDYITRIAVLDPSASETVELKGVLVSVVPAQAVFFSSSETLDSTTILCSKKFTAEEYASEDSSATLVVPLTAKALAVCYPVDNPIKGEVKSNRLLAFCGRESETYSMYISASGELKSGSGWVVSHIPVNSYSSFRLQGNGPVANSYPTLAFYSDETTFDSNTLIGKIHYSKDEAIDEWVSVPANAVVMLMLDYTSTRSLRITGWRADSDRSRWSVGDRNTNTYIGSMNTVIDAMLAANPKVEFAFVGIFSQDIRIGNGGNGCDGAGRRLKNIQRTLAEYWGAQLIDMDVFSLMKKGSVDTINTWIKDGVHPAAAPDWDVDENGNIRYSLVAKMGRRLAKELEYRFDDWQDRHVLWIGTSIPAGYGGSGEASKYPSVVASLLGTSVTNKSQPGGCIRLTNMDGTACSNSFLNTANSINYQNSLVDIVADYDLVVFDHGINDFANDPTDFDASLWKL